MLGEIDLALFLAASLALIITPGQDNIYIITRGIAQGRKAAMVSAWGVCCGLIFHTSFAALGLSVLLARSAAAFQVVKYVGAAYLIYLGIKTFLDKEGFVASAESARTTGLKEVFVQGVASNVLNPKVALFFLAFLPQFADPNSSSALQFLLLGSVFALLALIVTGVIAYFSGGMGDWLGRRPRFANALRWLTGSVLVGLGVRLAFSERR